MADNKHSGMLPVGATTTRALRNRLDGTFANVEFELIGDDLFCLVSPVRFDDVALTPMVSSFACLLLLPAEGDVMISYHAKLVTSSYETPPMQT
jgi:hypothetical protein